VFWLDLEPFERELTLRRLDFGEVDTRGEGVRLRAAEREGLLRLLLDCALALAELERPLRERVDRGFGLFVEEAFVCGAILGTPFLWN
jgi:hypothetical protein